MSSSRHFCAIPCCWTVHTRTLTATTVVTCAYDAANPLNYFYEDGVLTDLDWDANGNLRTQGTNVYTWDAANRLVSANADGAVSSFEYDGMPAPVAQAQVGNRTAQTRARQVQGQILARDEATACLSTTI